MPTSSQSQILSVVDYQLHKKQKQQQYQDVQTRPTNSYVRIGISPTKRFPYQEIKRRSVDEKTDSNNDGLSSTSQTTFVHRSSTEKLNDDRHLLLSRFRNFRKPKRNTKSNYQSEYYSLSVRGSSLSRAPQRHDLLHMPVININDMTRNTASNSTVTTTTPMKNPLITTSFIGFNDGSQSKIIIPKMNKVNSNQINLIDSSTDSFLRRRSVTDSEQEDQSMTDYRLKLIKRHPTLIDPEDDPSPTPEFGDIIGQGESETEITDVQKAAGLNENARRLMMLGTIRPSKTFYKNLPDADINHLMTYFHRMKTTNQRATTEEINKELSEQHIEYKPKIFFDSTCVTKAQVIHLERLIEPYADQIKSKRAELIRLENPVRFIVKSIESDQPWTTIPREYHDCLITLVSQSDPLHKSKLVNDLVSEKLIEDVKSNSLDISYFPGGINYDVPREQIDENGQMAIETYQKLKKRLSGRKIWHFSGPPEKRPNSLIAIIPADVPFQVDHQCLLDAIYERLKTVSSDETQTIEELILSIEYVPLSCILSSIDVANQFIVECDCNQTKQKLLENPLKIVSNKHSFTIELQSHDETMQKEFEKFIKAEKYQELLKNHEDAKKKLTNNKKTA